MPRYFFHTHIGDDVVVDPDGRELAEEAEEAVLEFLLIDALVAHAVPPPMEEPDGEGGTLH